jgi:AraC-like DNA-binding protein
MLYQPLVLDNSNWDEYRPRLSSYPLRVSKLRMIESPIKVKSISLKYVWSGEENYTLGAKSYQLHDNQFAVMNKFSECRVSINDKNTSTGICIDLDENYFSNVLYSLYYPNNIDSLNTNLNFFLTEECFTQGRHATGNLQVLLNSLMRLTETNSYMVYKDDFLKDMTSELIFSQEKIIREYNRLSTVKISTRKELFARLLKAKDMMSESGMHSKTIKEIASAVCLSEFHFHHLFKKSFGITPLKFKTHKTIQHAIRLHAAENLSWTRIAFILGFPDIQTFSKVFKRVTGHSPKESHLFNSNDKNRDCFE